jgi:uncharacterized protein
MNTQIILSIVAIGVLAGALSGLVGVGGGIILVPATVFILNYTQHQAQGTSLGVLTFPVVILAFIHYYRTCQTNNTPINFGVIGLLAIGFLAGSLIGSSLALKIDQQLLKKIFAVILFYTGIKMMGWDKTIINLFR